GGSIYYIVAGLLLLVTAVLLKKSNSKAFWVYAALMLGTVIWGVWEAGTDFWALAPRFDILGLLGLWLLIPAVSRGISDAKTGKIALSGTLIIAIVVMIYSIFNDPQEIHGEIKTEQPKQAQATTGVAPEDWPA